MAFKDFDAARREATGEAPEFQLGGERFVCVQRPTVGVICDILDSEMANNPGASIVMIVRYIRSLIADEASGVRFEALMHRKEDPIDGAELVELSNWLSEHYSGNPTDGASSSDGGPPPTGDDSKSAALPPLGD